MNRLQTFRTVLNSIFGGHSSVYNVFEEGQYLDSIGIDPEIPLGSLVKPSGVTAPSRYAKFSSLLSSAPMFISGASTTAGVFVYEANGSVLSYNSAYAGEAFEGSPGSETISSGAGNGMVIYNDYLYCATASTISRKGPLSSTNPTWQYDYWVSGLGMSALTNSAYPATRNVNYPNHVLHVHNDGYVYIADYDGANGRIHAFITGSDGSGGVGTFNAHTLPPGLMPMSFESYGKYLSIPCSPAAQWASGSIPKPGRSQLIFWDGVAPRAYQRVPINEPLASAIIVKNGELFITAGNIDAGFKLLRYLGGDSFEPIVTIPEGSPPPAGAIDSIGNMIAFGGWGTVPATAAGAYACGHRNVKLPGNSLHHIARISDSSSGTLPIVTCLKFLQRNMFPTLGWRTDTPANFGLDNRAGSGTYQSIFRSRVDAVGRPFKVRRISIPLSGPVTSGVSVRMSLYVDNESNAFVLDSINATNFPNSERVIDLQSVDAEGFSNYFLRAEFDGTDEIAFLPGIIAEGEYTD